MKIKVINGKGREVNPFEAHYKATGIMFKDYENFESVVIPYPYAAVIEFITYFNKGKDGKATDI